METSATVVSWETGVNATGRCCGDGSAPADLPGLALGHEDRPRLVNPGRRVEPSSDKNVLGQMTGVSCQTAGVRAQAVAASGLRRVYSR
jgi:hypothetical protein